MQFRYKFIHFVKIEDKPKTSVWECRSNRSEDALGRLKWYGPWRQYCFFPKPCAEVVFNNACLKDICHFIEQLKGIKPCQK